MKMTSKIDGDTFYKIGNLLSTSNELIQNILEGLSYFDLLRAAKVSQNWASVALSIIQSKRKLCYLTLHNPELPTTETKASTKGIATASPPSLEEFFQTLSIRPAVCLGFTNGDWLLNPSYFATRTSLKDSSLIGHLRELLPQTCQLCLVGARGVIGSVERSSLRNSTSDPKRALRNALFPEEMAKPSSSTAPNTASEIDSSEGTTQSQVSPRALDRVEYSIEVEEEAFAKETNALTLILIPAQPKVKINVVHLDQKILVKKFMSNSPSTKITSLSAHEFNGLCNLSPDEDLKALLLFDSHFDKFTELFLDAAVARQSQKLALGGGYIEQVQPGEGSYAVVISGENVAAASIILPISIKKPRVVEASLQRLKDCGFPEEQSIAFLFSCCGRGSHWYKRGNETLEDCSNVETKIFRKLFPNTPIFGFFGDGEVGLNYLPKHTSSLFEDLLPMKKSKKRVFHSYTSVIVLISIL